MNYISLIFSSTMLLTVSAGVIACSSDDSSSNGSVGGAAGSAGHATQDAGNHDTGAQDSGAGGSATDSGTTDASTKDSSPLDSATHDSSPSQDAGGADAAPPEKCSDISADECFSNYDCKTDTDRCDNVGTAALPVACCVPGTRGTKQVGAPCTDSNECESGVCIEGNGKQLCSGTCANTEQCPDTMKDCKPIAFSGSSDSWCFPTK